MTLRLADHCGRYLSELAHYDQRITVLDGDLADSDGAIHFAAEHPRRFIMAGIAEQCMVSMAAGMASCGLRPWVFSFGAFLCYRAYDQIRVCLSQSVQPVTLVGSHAGGCSARNGQSHTALNDISLMASLPNMQVWAPADEGDVRFAVRDILGGEMPTYVRLPRRPAEPLPGEPSHYRWLGRPARVAMLTTGLGTHLALAAQAPLATRGLEVGILHLAKIWPLPEDLLSEVLAGVDTLFIVEDHYTFGGLGSIVQHAGSSAKVVGLGWQNDWPGQCGDDEELLELRGPSPRRIATAVAANFGLDLI